MTRERWWAFPGEVVAQTDNRCLQLVLCEGLPSAATLELIHETPPKVTRVTFDYPSGNFEDIPLGLPGRSQYLLEKRLRDHRPGRTLSAPDLWLLKHAAARLGRRPLYIDEFQARADIESKFDHDREDIRFGIDRMTPHLLERTTVAPADRRLTISLDGISRTDVAAKMHFVVTSYLQAIGRRFLAQPEVRSTTFRSIFPNSDYLQVTPRWIVDVLTLAALTSPIEGEIDSQTELMFPADIESLATVGRVPGFTTGIIDHRQLWTHAYKTRSSLRSWPHALPRVADATPRDVTAQVVPLVRSRPARPAQLPTAVARKHVGPDTLPLVDRVSDEQRNARFGSWLAGARIGKGGYGAIYEAEHVSTQRPAALKVIPIENDEAQARFDREAEMLGKLEHPSLPEIFDCGRIVHERLGFLALERLEGCDLGALRDSSYRFTEAELLAIVATLADALVYLHERGVVHRDIKPSNVFLRVRNDRPDRELLLIDLGCAHSAWFATITKDLIGTVSYQAPEAFTEPVTSAADIWSLGVTVITLALGNNPFDKGEPAPTMAAICEGEIPILPAKQFPVLAPLCVRMLQRDHTQRMTADQVRSSMHPAVLLT